MFAASSFLGRVDVLWEVLLAVGAAAAGGTVGFLIGRRGQEPPSASALGKRTAGPPTIGIPRGPVVSQKPPAPRTPTPQPQPEPPAAVDTSPPTSTVADWQLAELHREQISLQIRIDDLMGELERTAAERDSQRARADRTDGNLNELRLILGQHEAMIASLERERAEYRERLSRAEGLK